MKLIWKLFLPFFLLSFLFSACYKNIAKTLRDDIELEVKRDYTIHYDSTYTDRGLGVLYSEMPTGDTLNIILTHGIGTPEKDHFKRFKQLLVKGLYFAGKRPNEGPDTIKFNNDVFSTNALIHPPAIVQSVYKIKGKTVSIYDVDWSPVTKGAKQMINNLDTNSFRTAISAKAKSEVLIDDFADLSIYMSDFYRKMIQRPFVDLLQYLNHPDKKSKTVFIGGSTGNEIFFGALDSVGAVSGLDLDRIYMISNQLPFTAQLNIAGKEAVHQKSFVEKLYRPLINFRKANGRAPNIISFYDPNDVFGYKLPIPDSFGIEGISVHNIKVENTFEWSFNPELLRNEYLGGVKDKKSKATTREILKQDEERQNIKINFKGSSKAAKNNLAIVGGIIQGTTFTTTDYNTSFNLVSYERDSNNVKTKSFKTKKNKKKVKYDVPKKKGAPPFLKKIVFNWVNFQIEKVKLSPNVQLPYEYPSKDFNGKSPSITGIRQSVDANEVTNVVTLHGIRTKATNHFNKMIAGVVEQLEFEPAPVRVDTVTLPNELMVYTKLDTLPSVLVKEFKHKDSSDKLLRFYVVHWSPITVPAKATLAALDDGHSASAKNSFVIQMLRSEIVNDGFSDIPLSANGMQPYIFSLLDKAFELMLTDDPFAASLRMSESSVKNNYLITSSMGSGLMMDYLLKRLATDTLHQNVRKVLEKTDQFYMLTNQLPILTLKNLDGRIQDCKEYVEEMYGNWSPGYPKLKIVAFNDPNDVLGFRLPMPEGRPNLSVQNMSLNIADGYQVNKFYTAKLVKKADKVFCKMIDKKSLKKERNKIIDQSKMGEQSRFWKRASVEEMDLEASKYKRLASGVVFDYIDTKRKKEAVQKLVLRIDNAHDASSISPLMFRILAKGTDDVKKTKTGELPPPGCE
ncbi:MAG: hypothetical protein AAFZ15_26490 [Bacteroidota bacterium]